MPQDKKGNQDKKGKKTLHKTVHQKRVIPKGAPKNYGQAITTVPAKKMKRTLTPIMKKVKYRVSEPLAKSPTLRKENHKGRTGSSSISWN